MSRLRVVAKDGSGSDIEVSMAQAIEALMQACIAANPVTVFLAYETVSMKDSAVEVTMSIKSAPESVALREGYADRIYRMHFPPLDDTDV